MEVQSCKKPVLGYERGLGWGEEALRRAGTVVRLQSLSCLLCALETVQRDTVLSGSAKLCDGRLSLALSGEVVKPEGGLLAIVLPHYCSLDSCRL